VIEHFKTVLISIVFTLSLSLLITGCSSTAPDAANESEVESQDATSSAPSAVENRLYKETVKESIDKEEEQKLKKRKPSDDDMERLD
jgi:starvation-inducible outer membrane lipoprotein